jgi:hypothetical protein
MTKFHKCYPLFILVFALIYSCQKDVLSPAAKLDEDQIREAKLQFELAKSTFKENTSEIIQPSVNWEEAFVKGKGVRVPLEVGGIVEYHVPSTSYKFSYVEVTYLVIYKDKNDSFHFEKVTTLPDEKYFKDHLSKRNFTGLLLINDWYGGKLKRIYKYTSGVKSKIAFTQTNNTINARSMNSTNSATCGWYGGYTSCIGAGGTQTCTTYPGTYVCFSSGGEPGDETGDNPPPPGPITEEEAPDGPGDVSPEPPRQEIEDDLTDTCFKKALIKVSQRNFTDTISKVMQSLVQNSRILVKVSQAESVTVRGQEVDGVTKDYKYDTETHNFEATIVINAGILNSASQEYTASTIVHETLHAWLQFIAGRITDHDKNHENLATNFVVPMANLYKNVYPNITNKEATALAWGGLQGTALWNSSLSSESFSVNDGTTMSYAEMQGLLNGHHFGIIGTKKCGDGLN